ncbi:hypothetical protein DER45DRAFT_575007 [Fusarium avenaceum]|nr:hypothetical protein DER45DRAFT_575007 [Fusarium avenaceum]
MELLQLKAQPPMLPTIPKLQRWKTLLFKSRSLNASIVIFLFVSPPFSCLLPPRKLIMYLQDRLYFRGTKFQRQVLGIERSVNKRIDDKIAEMTTVLDAQYLHIMRAANRKATQLRTENRGLARRVERVEKQNRILERKLDELLDDVSINRSEMLRERLSRTRARFAQQRHDDNDNDGTGGFIMD